MADFVETRSAFEGENAYKQSIRLTSFSCKAHRSNPKAHRSKRLDVENLIWTHLTEKIAWKQQEKSFQVQNSSQLLKKKR